MSHLTRWLLISLVFVAAIALLPAPAITAQGGIMVTTKGQANLRSGPGTNYSPLTRIPDNTVLPAVGRNDKTSWIQVSFNNILGWISTGVLTPDGDLNTLPIIVVPVPTRAPRPTPVSAIPLYDDFNEPTINADRWYAVGSNFTQVIDKGSLVFTISDWLQTRVKITTPMREISVLMTMEQTSSAGSSLTFTIAGSHVYTFMIVDCKSIVTIEFVNGNSWINGKSRNLPGHKCPSTHLLRFSVDSSHANFYLDKRKIESLPWTGDIQQAWVGGSTSQPNVNDPNFKPAIGRVQSVWIRFAQ